MRRKARKTTTGAIRNPDRTRERILAAARREFAARGFAGARVDAIARQSRTNKRMLYHYFVNKEGLFRAVLRQKISQQQEWAAELPGDPAERLPFWFQKACDDPSWIRLLEWEALQSDEKKIIDEDQRRERSADWTNRLRERQERGELTREFDVRHLALAMQSLTMFPVAFPQLARLITGQKISDPAFQKAYAQFIRQFAAVFQAKGKK